MHFLQFLTIKTLTLRKDHAKLLDVLTSLPVSRSILPRAMYFATSRQANHAICSFIDSSGYASGPIRTCLFIDYILIIFNITMTYLCNFMTVLKYIWKNSDIISSLFTEEQMATNVSIYI